MKCHLLVVSDTPGVFRTTKEGAMGESGGNMGKPGGDCGRTRRGYGKTKRGLESALGSLG